MLDIHLFSYSQQLSPECQALTNDIQERAKSDAESDRFNLQNLEGSRRNIEDLNNLFGEENKKYNCYTNNKILTIYDLNYESHEFPYFLAIITILLLFIGAVLGRFFEKNLIEPASKKLGKLWEAIYQQFAGSIFLLGTALKRYNKKLI